MLLKTGLFKIAWTIMLWEPLLSHIHIPRVESFRLICWTSYFVIFWHIIWILKKIGFLPRWNLQARPRSKKKKGHRNFTEIDAWGCCKGKACGKLRQNRFLCGKRRWKEFFLYFNLSANHIQSQTGSYFASLSNFSFFSFKIIAEWTGKNAIFLH